MAIGAFILFLISNFLSYKLAPLAIKIGSKFELFDKVEDRKINKRSLLRIGGIIFLVNILLLNFFLMFLSKFIDINLPDIENFFLISIIISISSFTLGFIDDIKSLSPITRLIVQIGIAFFIWTSGVKIENIDISILSLKAKFIPLNESFSLILTILWITGLTNAINWIDGLDGLACSLIGFSSLSLGIFFLHIGQAMLGLMLVSISGICFGFLIVNKYPAKLIMGDGGTYLLGFNLAFLSLLGTGNNLITNDYSFVVQNFNIVLMIFSVPILDMVYVILYRIYNSLSPFYPDKNHLHHRLLNYGLSHQKTVTFIFILNFVVCCLSLFIFW